MRWPAYLFDCGDRQLIPNSSYRGAPNADSAWSSVVPSARLAARIRSGSARRMVIDAPDVRAGVNGSWRPDAVGPRPGRQLARRQAGHARCPPVVALPGRGTCGGARSAATVPMVLPWPAPARRLARLRPPPARPGPVVHPAQRPVHAGDRPG